MAKRQFHVIDKDNDIRATLPSKVAADEFIVHLHAVGDAFGPYVVEEIV